MIINLNLNLCMQTSQDKQTYRNEFMQFVYSKYSEAYRDGRYDGRMLIDACDGEIEIESYPKFDFIMRLNGEYEMLTEDSVNLIKERLTLVDDIFDVSVIIKDYEDADFDKKLESIVNTYNKICSTFQNRYVMILIFNRYSSIVKYVDGVPDHDLDILRIQSIKSHVNTIFKYINLVRQKSISEYCVDYALSGIREKVQEFITYDCADGLEYVIV